MQQARNFEEDVYRQCPWFLEYNEGYFPPDEEKFHNDAVRAQSERTSKLVVTPRLPEQELNVEPVETSVEEVFIELNFILYLIN